MNYLRIIRNNWKKSAFGAAAAGYGVYSLKSYYDVTQHMRQVCEEVAAIGLKSDGAQKKILVVLNPVANKKKAEKSFKKYCEPILHLSGYFVETLRTSHIGHAKSYVEELNSLPDAIVVAGGDGTASEVVTGLMRRKGDICPIAVLPLGFTSQTASKFFPMSRKNDLDYAKALLRALLPLLSDKVKNESVIQYDVLESNSQDNNNNNGDANPTTALKPIYGLNRFSWGLIKDIDNSKDKYWYFGSLRHYAAAFLKSFSSSLKWNFETDYVYTPPCAGCSNCYTERQTVKPTAGFFLSKLVSSSKNTASKEKQIRNENCTTTVEGRIKSNQLNIDCNHNDENFSELETKFINSLQPGWEFIKNIPNITKNSIEPNVVLKSRTIQLFPATTDSENIFYSIDGEEYDARPIKVSVVPNAIKVFC